MTPELCPSPDFDLETVWHLDARPEELTAIVLDPERIDLWAPSVFMHAELVERGAADGLGLSIRLQTKGFLPHSFFFVATIVDLVPHRWMRIAVTGDFHGYGDMEVTPDGDGGCRAVLRWITAIEQPYLRPLVLALRPVLAWNHRWSMRSAHRSMQAEVWRRREATGISPPRPATFPHNFALVRDWQRRRAAHRGWRLDG